MRVATSRGKPCVSAIACSARSLVLGLVAAACGDDDDDAGSDDDTDTDDHRIADGHRRRLRTRRRPIHRRPAEPAEGAAITIALGSEPTSLDPHLVDDGGERAINDNIYETLLARTPDGELIPSLATALPTQVDDTTWEFTLRDDVTFHDGTPFNADSVVATVERMIGLIEAGATDNDGFYSHAHRRREGRRRRRSGSPPPSPTACSRRACTG